MEKRIYLDNNATTQIAPEVKEAIEEAIDLFGNPSSHGKHGQIARKKVEEARKKVAEFLNAEPEEILFTGGGSESDNTVLKDLLFKKIENPNKEISIITSPVEHPAILETCRDLEKFGIKTKYLPMYENGIVKAEDLKTMINPETALVSVMYANNETGTIMPIKEMAKIAHENGILFHTDAVQVAGKLKIDVKDLDVDFLSLSGHKMYAPKGVGVLYIKKGHKLSRLISGGHQENGRRAGTENTLGIIALGKAAEIAMRDISSEEEKIRKMRDRLEKGLLEKIPYSYINGDRENRVYNTINISFDLIEGEAILYLLDHLGIEVSTGSACSSGDLNPSHVLNAMKLPTERMHSSIRISFGKFNTEEEVDYVLENFPKVISTLREMSPFSK